MAQFDVNSTSVENIISSIKAGEITIPEIRVPSYGMARRSVT